MAWSKFQFDWENWGSNNSHKTHWFESVCQPDQGAWRPGNSYRVKCFFFRLELIQTAWWASILSQEVEKQAWGFENGW